MTGPLAVETRRCQATRARGFSARRGIAGSALQNCVTQEIHTAGEFTSLLQEAAIVHERSSREPLVERLCRSGLIRSAEVQHALLTVPRERFVPEHVAQLGLEAVYRNEVIVTLKDEHGAPLSSSSQPGLMAQMLEHLHLTPGLQVLEIGAGTGHNAALLAELVGPQGRVVTLDVDPTVAARARQHLADGGHWAEVVVGDGIEGWPAAAPFDRIIVTATPPHIPRAWLEQLRPGGLLEVPMMLGRGGAVVTVVVTLQRVGSEFVSRGIMPGAFMPFRSNGRVPPRPSGWSLGWYDTDGRHRGHSGYVAGNGLRRLSAAAKRRLLSGLLQARPHHVKIRKAAGLGLQLYLVCAAPSEQLVFVLSRMTQNIGLIDDRGNLALVRHGWGRRGVAPTTRVDRYGDQGGAGQSLLAIIEAWEALDRPGLDRFEVRVGFGRYPKGATWRLYYGGESRVGVSLLATPGFAQTRVRRGQQVVEAGDTTVDS